MLSQRSPLKFCVLLAILSVPIIVLGTLVDSPGWMPMRMPWSMTIFTLPLVVALILTHREEGGPGVRRLLARIFDQKRIRNKVWYVPILFLFPALTALSYVIMRLTGQAVPEPKISYVSIAIYLVVYFIGGVFEELGWMGYLADPMQARFGALNASLVMGVIWALWHVVGWSYSHTPIWVVWQGLSAVALRVIIFWIYTNTGRSVFAAILFHDVVNVAQSVFPNEGSHYDAAVAGPLIVLTALVVMLVWGRTLSLSNRGCELDRQ